MLKDLCAFSLSPFFKSQMLLQLVGGSQRLSPQNSHQTPSVVVLCGGGGGSGGGGGGGLESSSHILESPSAIGLAIAR